MHLSRGLDMDEMFSGLFFLIARFHPVGTSPEIQCISANNALDATKQSLLLTCAKWKTLQSGRITEVSSLNYLRHIIKSSNLNCFCWLEYGRTRMLQWGRFFRYDMIQLYCQFFTEILLLWLLFWFLFHDQNWTTKEEQRTALSGFGQSLVKLRLTAQHRVVTCQSEPLRSNWLPTGCHWWWRNLIGLFWLWRIVESPSCFLFPHSFYGIFS